MKIEFQRTIIDNFCTFIDHQVFDFVGRGAGLHYIYGENRDEPALESNGSGKSSLFDAMCWCQYGRTTDGRKAPDIRPRHHKGTTRVTNVMLVDGEKTSITRQANPNTLTMNGKTCSQEQIDVLMPFNLFASTILIGQGQPLFFDLKPAAKMELFSDALDLERWEQRSSLAREKVISAELELGETIRSLEHQKTVKSQLDETIAKIKERITEWNEAQQERVFDNNKELGRNEFELAKQIKVRDKANLTYDGASAEVKAIVQKIEDITENKLPPMYQSNNLTKTRQEFVGREIDNLHNALGKIADEDTCPTCGQKITGTELAKHRKEIKNQIRGKERELEDLNKQLLTVKINKVEKERKELREQITPFKEKADNARSALDRLIPITAKLEADIKVLKRKIEDDNNSLNPYQDQMNMNRKSRSETVAKIRELEDAVPKIEGRIERYKFWTKGFKDIRLYIIDEVLKELEHVTNNILEDVGLVDWEIQYEVERVTQAGTTQRGLNILIKGPRDKEPVKWQCWSKGEGQRLRLIGAMALSDVLLSYAGIETNIEIFDEPTVHITKRGIDNLCELLAARADMNGKIVFFIDHKAVESSYFASSLKVVKSKDGKSKLIT